MSGKALPWVVAGGAVVALGAVLLAGRGHGSHHPEPRSGVTAIGVLQPEAVPRVPGAIEAYAAARSAPALLDGLYCHCHCRENANHRSLLTCFESEHGAYCDICMNEAVLATQMAAGGSSLTQIRQAIDARFGS
ncbi:MAG: CYCXC family (seleno)protein [Gemmatimonadota bacterium]